MILSEIEGAAETLPMDEQEKLLRSLMDRLHDPELSFGRARAIRRGDDLLLEAAPGAPPMTPENIKRMLQGWPEIRNLQALHDPL